MPDETTAPASPDFFAIQGELPRLPVPTDAQSPLKKLGPSPFTRSSFPTLGFLQSVYEHIQERTAKPTR